MQHWIRVTLQKLPLQPMELRERGTERDFTVYIFVNGVLYDSRRASDGGTSIASIQLPSKSDHEYTSRSSQRSSDRTDLTDKINRSDYVDKPERTDYDRSSLSTASRDIRSLVERPKDNDRRSQSRESRAAVDRPRTGRVPVVKRDAVEARKEASNAKFPPNSNEKHENQVRACILYHFVIRSASVHGWTSKKRKDRRKDLQLR